MTGGFWPCTVKKWGEKRGNLWCLQSQIRETPAKKLMKEKKSTEKREKGEFQKVAANREHSTH